MGGIDWPNRCCSTPLAITFVCIHMHGKIFWCSYYGDPNVQIGGLTYLPLWENVTNYLHGIKLWNNLHFSIFKPLFLAKSTCFHHFLYIYLMYTEEITCLTINGKKLACTRYLETMFRMCIIVCLNTLTIIQGYLRQWLVWQIWWFFF